NVLDIVSQAIGPVDMTVDTTDITVSAQSDVTLHSNTLTSATVTAPDQPVVFDVTKPTLTFSLNGEMQEATFFTTNVEDLVFDPSLIVDSLVLSNTNIDTLDTGNTIDTLNITTSLSTLTINGALTDITVIGTQLDTLNVTSSLTDATLALTNNTAIFGLLGNIDHVIMTNHTLTSFDVQSMVLKTLTLTSDTLQTLDTTNSLVETLVLNLNADNYDITTEASNIELTGNVTDTGYFNLSHTTPIIASNMNEFSVTANQATSLTLDAATSDVSVSGNLLETLAGTVTNFTVNSTNDITSHLNAETFTHSGAGQLSITDVLDGNTITTDSTNVTVSSSNAAVTASLNLTSASNAIVSVTELDTLAITADNLTEIDITSLTTDVVLSGVSINTITGDMLTLAITAVDPTALSITGTLTSLVLDGTYILDTMTIDNTVSEIDTTTVDLTTLDVTTTNPLTVTTLAPVIIHDGDTVTINTQQNGQNITTNASAVGLNSSSNHSVTLNNTSINTMTLDMNTYNTVTVDIQASSMVVSGNVNGLDITGTSLTTLDTDSLTVDTTLTLTDTLITELSFMSTTLLSSIDTIPINTLSTGDIASIVDILEGTTIELVSPVTQADINTYYYDTEYARLWEIEETDQARYDSFRASAIDAAYQVMIDNQYLSHIDEATLRTEIDEQNYRTVDAYYQSYLDSQGLTSSPDEQLIKDSITATLNDPLLDITETDLNNEVEASIVADAETVRDNQESTQTFVIS
ncbi:MAG: hypothetical protein K9L26_02595, partial [Candidatus Izimaplasma sp.]|nr:hypothetical protein [Candidatus Izimaplasma bacterium]